jgi:hypothetical protein
MLTGQPPPRARRRSERCGLASFTVTRSAPWHLSGTPPHRGWSTSGPRDSRWAGTKEHTLAIRQLLRVQERKARLMGLDAPTAGRGRHHPLHVYGGDRRPGGRHRPPGGRARARVLTVSGSCYPRFLNTRDRARQELLSGATPGPGRSTGRWPARLGPGDAPSPGPIGRHLVLGERAATRRWAR